MQRYSSYIFSVLPRTLNRVSRNLRVPSALRVNHGDPGVRVHFFSLLAQAVFQFPLSPVNTLKEGEQFQMWEFISI